MFAGSDLRDELRLPHLLGFLLRGDRRGRASWKRKVIDGHPVAFAVMHHVESPGVLAARARLAAAAATTFSNSHAGPPFGSTRLGWVRLDESSRGHLRDETSFPERRTAGRSVRRASTRAARSLRGSRRIPRPRTLSSCDSAVRSSRATHPPLAASCPQYAPIRCTSSSSSVPLRTVVGVGCTTPNVCDGEPSRDGATGGRSPQAIGSRGGLGQAGFRA